MKELTDKSMLALADVLKNMNHLKVVTINMKRYPNRLEI